ncbi:MAG: hypothetical protein BMS9Abin29_2092 [Gemmatimonadota bacterium]|nr:MAG: hypothetical protein BMS9Abin29_2092 [Gemmatimonadota bacterium]
MFFRSCAILLILVLVACSSDAPGLGQVEPLDTPAGEDSRWPALSSDGDGVILSWLVPDASGTWSLRMARLDDSGWGDVRTVATEGARPFFVNWADFPAVWAVSTEMLAAHWLVRGDEGGYDYGVRVAFSSDGGERWSEPWTPHEDGTPTEHGFVSMVPVSDGEVGMVWLDGRKSARTEDGGEGLAEMTLRFRTGSLGGPPGPETLLDDLICDCCKTDAAVTGRGPIVVYRNRTHAEVRDIYVARLTGEGWTPGHAVHDDGWVFPACPVNGPAIDADGESVVVAWFTGANDEPKVKVAFSSDAGELFGPPTEVDLGNPLGRVDVLLLEDGSALVSWIEGRGQDAEILARRVQPGGSMDRPEGISPTSAGRDSGFPRMLQDAHGRILFAWTASGNPTSVRVARTGG